MDVATLLRLLRLRRAFAVRDRWTRRALEVYQAGALRDLRDFAYARSPFYRRFHKGLEDRPLAALPVLTKAALMEHFDDLVTDPAVRREDVVAYLDAGAGAPFLGRYRVAATSGSTGQRGYFLWDPDEWLTVLASYARANDWAHVAAGLPRRLRLAVVSSRAPAHQSALVGATLQSRWVPTLRLDANAPLVTLAARLDAFQPQSLVAYASMARLLAEEQLAGRLHIAPRAVMSASEVLTAEARRRIRAAWGVEPFDVYAATETAGVASECDRHAGLHLYEDLVITEVVDDRDRPVPPGVEGARTLVTVLFNRTQPLVRYAMSDQLRPAAAPCACGRPFALLEGVAGRAEDVLRMPGHGGTPVAVHPVLFHRVLEPLPVAAWQVVWDGATLRVLLVAPDDPTRDARVATALTGELAAQGVAPPVVHVERVAAIPRSAVGKAPLVRAA